MNARASSPAPAAPDGTNAPGDPGGGGTLGVVVPVFNEAGNVEALLGRLVPVLEASGMDWEVLFVDDGSRDRTAEVVKAVHAREPRVALLSFSRNFGKEVAIAAGLRRVGGDAVVLIDADLQHPPELIGRFLERWREGYHMVYGQRRDRHADGPVRRYLALAFYRLFQWLSGTELPLGAGDYRLLDRRAVDALNSLSERARFSKGLYSWIGFHSCGVEFDIPHRAGGGGSRWSLRTLTRFAIDGVVSFSTLPLKIWSYVGLFISFCAFFYVLVFLSKTLVFGIDVPGFPTMVVSMMFFSGVQLMSLGIIGEYIARIYDESKARPLFVVLEEVGAGAAPRSLADAAAPDAAVPAAEAPAPAASPSGAIPASASLEETA